MDIIKIVSFKYGNGWGTDKWAGRGGIVGEWGVVSIPFTYLFDFLSMLNRIASEFIDKLSNSNFVGY